MQDLHSIQTHRREAAIPQPFEPARCKRAEPSEPFEPGAAKRPHKITIDITHFFLYNNQVIVHRCHDATARIGL